MVSEGCCQHRAEPDKSEWVEVGLETSAWEECVRQPTMLCWRENIGRALQRAVMWAQDSVWMMLSRRLAFGRMVGSRERRVAVEDLEDLSPEKNCLERA